MMSDDEFNEMFRRTPEKAPLTPEEEADEIVRRLATPPTPLISRLVLPMIRRILPGKIANDIIGVQPMTGPVGKIHTMKIRYTKDQE